ncbi:MAG: DNA replication/repair protein RecF [Oenococcus sp.]|uniref:DNA replication/repair protein RecF n=1 Tax=Oenococcus TaxID=46254 RepID=UPI0021E88E0F|nr:DNA replication/repair protein RecF [Oenococcus kitaharae]MCV3296208.1 DNA replication/repair protein RecF [Oenococcus kitaharae]
MFLNNLRLVNFRNYKELNVAFSHSINVLIGNNAQGKTNLLEAIYFLSMGRSHRDSNDRDLINWSAKSAVISGEIESRTARYPLEVRIEKGGKRVLVNHLTENRLSDYIGNLNTVLFAPEDLELVKGSPGVRRKFIDSEFAQMSSNYLFNLLQYRNALKDRNAYLKNIKWVANSPKFDETYLSVLDDQLIKFGSAIILQRFSLIQTLEAYAREVHLAISKIEELKLCYITFPTVNEQSSQEEISEIFKKQLLKNRNRELFLKSTSVGPHHDDLKFLINGKEVGSFASQGQQRTTALSIRLAEIEMMKFETGEYPILLLDDVLSELDGKRQTQLLDFIQDKVQTFLTTASLSDIDKGLIKDPKIYHVKDGVLIND